MIIDFHFHFPTQKITESEAVSNAKWVKITKDLPRNALRGIRFTEEEV